MILWENTELRGSRFPHRTPGIFHIMLPSEQVVALGDDSQGGEGSCWFHFCIQSGDTHRTLTVVYMVCLERKEGPSQPLPYLAGWGKVMSHLCFACTWSADLLNIWGTLVRHLISDPETAELSVSVWCWGIAICPGLQAGILMVCDCFRPSSPAAIRHLAKIPALVQLKLLKLSTLSEKMIPSLSSGHLHMLYLLLGWCFFVLSLSLNIFSQRSLHWLDRRTKHPNQKFLWFLSKNKKHIFHFHQHIHCFVLLSSAFFQATS